MIHQYICICIFSDILKPEKLKSDSPDSERKNESKFGYFNPAFDVETGDGTLLILFLQFLKYINKLCSCHGNYMSTVKKKEHDCDRLKKDFPRHGA